MGYMRHAREPLSIDVRMSMYTCFQWFETTTMPPMLRSASTVLRPTGPHASSSPRCVRATLRFFFACPSSFPVPAETGDGAARLSSSPPGVRPSPTFGDPVGGGTIPDDDAAVDGGAEAETDTDTGTDTERSLSLALRKLNPSSSSDGVGSTASDELELGGGYDCDGLGVKSGRLVDWGGMGNAAIDEDVEPSRSDRAGAGDWRIVEKAGECGMGVDDKESRCAAPLGR